MVPPDAVRLDAALERHDPGLPRFAVVPAGAVAGWALEGTTVVDVTVNGHPVGRRALKYWGGGRDVWFLDLTEAQCRAAGVDTGDAVRLELRRATTTLPEEIRALLESDAGARGRWEALTESRRRRLAEHVRAAKRPETRRRRAEEGLGM